MSTFTHTGTGRARCWVDELPAATYRADPGRALRFDLTSTEVSLRVAQGAAGVELAVPRGPRSLYGLLGGTFRPNASGRCVVQIEVLDDRADPVPFEGGVGLRGDTYTKGLPAEYADAVAAGVRSALTSRAAGVPAGVLSIDRAAVGEASSSSVVFRQLALVMPLLVLRDLSLDDSAGLRVLLDLWASKM